MFRSVRRCALPEQEEHFDEGRRKSPPTEGCLVVKEAPCSARIGRKIWHRRLKDFHNEDSRTFPRSLKFVLSHQRPILRIDRKNAHLPQILRYSRGRSQYRA